MWISSGEGTTPSTFLLASGRSSTAINDRNCSGARGVEGTPAGPVYGNLRAAPSASQAAIVGGMGEGGGLRILFFADRPGGADRYMSLVSELSERGHEVHLAFQLSRGALPRKPAPPGVTYGFAPERRAFDGWLSVAWLVRAIGDLARYAHPRYEDAPVLRARMRKKVLKRLKKPGEFEPIGRRVALRLARRLASTTDAKLSERVIRASARLEAGIPTSRRIDRYIREWAPDVVLATPVVKAASTQVEFLKSARRLRIPAATCVASWDNLTNKGLLKFVPERVFVWNEVQRREATELHGIPAERVVATGAQLFDSWFERRPSMTREEFVRKVGLDPAQPYVLFLGSSPFVTNHSDYEVRFVVRWIEALRATGDERLQRLGIVIRPHPVAKGWGDADPGRFSRGAGGGYGRAARAGVVAAARACPGGSPQLGRSRGPACAAVTSPAAAPDPWKGAPSSACAAVGGVAERCRAFLACRYSCLPAAPRGRPGGRRCAQLGDCKAGGDSRQTAGEDVGGAFLDVVDQRAELIDRYERRIGVVPKVENMRVVSIELIAQAVYLPGEAKELRVQLHHQWNVLLQDAARPLQDVALVSLDVHEHQAYLRWIELALGYQVVEARQANLLRAPTGRFTGVCEHAGLPAARSEVEHAGPRPVRKSHLKRTDRFFDAIEYEVRAKQPEAVGRRFAGQDR